MNKDWRVRPTCACSPTPLRGRKILRILETDFGSTGIPVYRGGAADARGVGPRGATSPFVACLDGNRTRHAQSRRPRLRACPPSRSAGAPALIACGSYWLLPILTERQRSMPSSQVSRQLAAALTTQ
jgi:hypothetical protein